ncbi:MAG: BamA/TamA family outer membrane protein [Bacteroidales bacterium]
MLSLLTSCSVTRYVPEDEYFLKRVDLNIDNKKIDATDLKASINTRANTKILGLFKFHLWLYNLSPKDKEGGWMKNTGEVPAIYNSTAQSGTEDLIRVYMQNRGYYNSSVQTKVAVDSSARKVSLNIDVKAGAPTVVEEIQVDVKDSVMARMFDENRGLLSIYGGSIFDATRMEKDIVRITELFQNNGYYKFNKDYMFFIADTLHKDKGVDLRFVIETPLDADSTALEHNVYKMGQYNIYLRDPAKRKRKRKADADEEGTRKIDTLEYKGVKIYYREPLRYKPRFLHRMIAGSMDSIYKLSNIDRIYRAFNASHNFNAISVSNRITDSAKNVLNTSVVLQPVRQQSIMAELKGSNQVGNIGVGINAKYQHRNIFRRAELFESEFKVSRENQIKALSNKEYPYKAWEYLFANTLTIPRFLGPLNPRRFINDKLPYTRFGLSYNYYSRIEYTRSIIKASMGYQWTSRQNRSHLLNLIEANYVDLKRIDAFFMSSIEDQYVKSSFSDQFIFGSSYLLSLRESSPNDSKYKYLRFSVKLAGNSLNGIASLLGSPKNIDSMTNDSYYSVFKVQFSQFVKGYLEAGIGIKLNAKNKLAFRALGGLGYAYGNSSVMPFVERFYNGGSNSLRAWGIRSLGPGSTKYKSGSYPNAAGDIILEGNAEYRFKLFSILEGCFFADAGNIWTLTNEPEAKFQFDKFYKQIAFGIGTGIRLDFNYFLIRFDLGLKVHDPGAEDNINWILFNRSLRAEDINLNFGIGYPF